MTEVEHQVGTAGTWSGSLPIPPAGAAATSAGSALPPSGEGEGVGAVGDDPARSGWDGVALPPSGEGEGDAGEVGDDPARSGQPDGAGEGEGPWRQPTLSAEPSDVAGPEQGFWPEPEGELPGRALRAALEAILLVVDEPVTELALAQAVDQPTDRVAGALADLAAEYTEAGRGIDLRRVAGGWRLYTRAEQAPYVERFVLDGQQARLTQAALETLAVVAYRQPVTRSRVAAVRGVNCDGVFRTLLTRGLVEEAGTEPESGAHLYRTTSVFLEKLGLDSLDELPPLAPFLPDDVASLDPDAPEPDLAPAATTPQPEQPGAGTTAEPGQLAESHAGAAAEPEPPAEPAAGAPVGTEHAAELRDEPAGEPGGPEQAPDLDPGRSAEPGAEPAGESAEAATWDDAGEEQPAGLRQQVAPDLGVPEPGQEPVASETGTAGAGSVPVERRNGSSSVQVAGDGLA